MPDTSGLRLVTKNKNGYGYSPNQANTLAGAINSAHDIMGMIIQEKNVTDDIEDLDVSNWNENYIYYIPSKEKFYRKLLILIKNIKDLNIKLINLINILHR